ncbi:MAG: hypothetical protein ABT15_05525 [Pseudonocardia sp. SCN 73-27]|nr:MAG: hypothetical protein ABT15_05525 [Pseudonocardia sp. SCN 73-27]
MTSTARSGVHAHTIPMTDLPSPSRIRPTASGSGNAMTSRPSSSTSSWCSSTSIAAPPVGTRTMPPRSGPGPARASSR